MCFYLMYNFPVASQPDPVFLEEQWNDFWAQGKKQEHGTPAEEQREVIKRGRGSSFGRCGVWMREICQSITSGNPY